MPLSTVICAMFRRYLNSFKKKGSRYIAWNILFLLGFGLWIALCISNMHHVDDSTKEEAALFCFQNSTLGIEYNASVITEAMEEMLHVTTVNYALHNLIVIVRTVLQYVQVFVSMSFMILFACSNEYVRKITRAWNNVCLSIYDEDS
ncbi:uncharacterized protein LOC108625125 [Ceratina calcarata]|uniref:Uncharacterized protein LOC108625125 n=1 Tax=Ceratina calcarata TaxID=156304 RepID=A0AAJ7S0Z4_9HYME|nr:uncharacterized protein LOC108625125 [Ceratina calcarata]